MNGDPEHQSPPQANDFGVAFTSSNPFVGYHYATQQTTTPSSFHRSSPSSILARSTAMEPSTPISRATSSSSHTTGSTAVASTSDSDSDSEMSSTSSHARRHATDGATNPSLTDLALKRLMSRSHSPFTAPPVTLLVGGRASPSKETQPVLFYVHENILTSPSPFFRAAFELNSHAAFSEGVSRTMKLPEDRPDDFAYLLQWVYWQHSNSPTNVSALGQSAQLGVQENSRSSLWHPAIDIPLAQFQAYRAMKKADQTLAAVAKHQSESPPYLSTVDANDWHFGLALQPNTQQPQAQPQVSPQPMTANEAGKDHPDASMDGTQPPPQQKPKLVRPPPPTFGPLIRLYILADKYALPTSLKEAICTRVRDVGREGRCVPDADDIAMLWEGVLEDASEREASGSVILGKVGSGDGVRTNLKNSVLEMYEGLSIRSFKGLFFPSSVASTTSTRAELMGAESGVQRRVQDDGEEAYQWHPIFMRDLLARKFEGRNAAATAVASAGGNGADGRDRDWESFGELGRVRRRERFPSLYGVRNRSGVELMGGSP